MNIKKWLDQRAETAAAEVEESKSLTGFKELPDGTYIALITVHTFCESKDEKPGVKTCYKVLEGEQAGECVWSWEDMERDDAFKWLAVRLRNCGVELEDHEPIFEQFKDNAEDLFDLVANRIVVKLNLKTKGGFQNKNVNRTLDDYEIPEEFLNENEDKSKKKSEPKENKSKKAEVSKAEKAEEEESAAEDEGETELAVGMTVQFKKGSKEYTGKVTEINGEEETVSVKDEAGKTHEIGIDQIIGIVENETV